MREHADRTLEKLRTMIDEKFAEFDVYAADDEDAHKREGRPYVLFAPQTSKDTRRTEMTPKTNLAYSK